MIPFKVFDRENKTTLVVINYHPGKDGGEYLVSREDDSDKDGELFMVPASKFPSFRMVDFVNDLE